jgi:hypothetical protein
MVVAEITSFFLASATVEFETILPLCPETAGDETLNVKEGEGRKEKVGGESTGMAL